jgi:hypothetical protein
MMDPKPLAMERETNLNARARYSSRYRHLSRRVRAPLPTTRVANGRRMKCPGNTISYKCSRNECSRNSSETCAQRPTIRTCTCEDNVTTLRYINKMGGTKSPKLTQIAKQILQFCLSKEITLTAEHLHGVPNQIENWESRHAFSSNTNNCTFSDK